MTTSCFTPSQLRREQGGPLWRAVNRSRATVVAARVDLALDFWRRLRGLLGRRLGPDDALLLAPCRGVHTFGMGYPIDVLALAADGRVLDVQTLRPYRIGRHVAGALAVLELPEGAVRRAQTQVGDEVVFER